MENAHDLMNKFIGAASNSPPYWKYLGPYHHNHKQPASGAKGLNMLGNSAGRVLS